MSSGDSKSFLAGFDVQRKLITDAIQVANAYGSTSSILDAVRVCRLPRALLPGGVSHGVLAAKVTQSHVAGVAKLLEASRRFAVSPAANAVIRLAGLGVKPDLLSSFAQNVEYVSRFWAAQSAVFDNAGFVEVFRQWQEALKLETQFVVVMSHFGWPPPRDLPRAAKHRIVDQFMALGDDLDGEATRCLAREAEREVLGHYDEVALDALLESWRSKHILARRLHLLESALDVHRSARYELSVPVMLAQAEGIVADGFNHRGRMTSQVYAEYRAKLFETTDEDQIEAAVNDALIGFCVGVVYVGFVHGEPIRSALSRHAIFHGADVDYGTEANSLKAVLLVDYLQESFRLTVLENSDVYHSDDCVALVRTTSRGRSYKSLDSVLAEGKRPCKRCRPPR